MGPTGDCWELGSDFHLPIDFGVSPSGEGAEWSANKVLYRSGRDALIRLLAHGKEKRGWKRLFVPTYFCQDVVATLIRTGIPVLTYPASPVRPPDLGGLSLGPGDVVFVVNFFGTGRNPGRPPAETGVEIIEDHTHDPWSSWAVDSSADWALASLRKTLPIPDGAALWSPRGHEAPQPRPAGNDPDRAYLEKLAGMTLKGLYLRGHTIEKPIFRALLKDGEARFSHSPGDAMSAWSEQVLRTWPITTWNRGRRENHSRAVEQLDGFSGVHPITAVGDNEIHPFSLVLEFESANAARLARRGLIAANVYPAVLWPLDDPLCDGVASEDVSLSQRLLSIHCDMRYGAADMDRVVTILRELA